MQAAAGASPSQDHATHRRLCLGVRLFQVDDLCGEGQSVSVEGLDRSTACAHVQHHLPNMPTVMLKPRLARARATALPIPCAPPVIRADFREADMGPTRSIVVVQTTLLESRRDSRGKLLGSGEGPPKCFQLSY
jgi:hypothetical protein